MANLTVAMLSKLILMSLIITANCKLTDPTLVPWVTCKSPTEDQLCFCADDAAPDPAHCTLFIYAELDRKASTIHWYFYAESNVTGENYFFLTKNRRPPIAKDTKTITFLNGAHLVVRVNTEGGTKDNPTDNHFTIALYKDNNVEEIIARKDDPNAAIGFSYGDSATFEPTWPSLALYWRYFEFVSPSVIRHKAADGTVDYSLNVLKHPLQINVLHKNDAKEVFQQYQSSSPRLLFPERPGLKDPTQIPWDKCEKSNKDWFCFMDQNCERRPTPGVKHYCDYVIFAEVHRDPSSKTARIFWYIWKQLDSLTTNYFFLTKDQRPPIAKDTTTVTFLDGEHLVVRVHTLTTANTPLDPFSIAFYKDNKDLETFAKQNDPNAVIGFNYGRSTDFKDTQDNHWKFFEFVSPPVISHKASDGTVDYSLDVFKDPLQINFLWKDEASHDIPFKQEQSNAPQLLFADKTPPPWTGLDDPTKMPWDACTTPKKNQFCLTNDDCDTIRARGSCHLFVYGEARRVPGTSKATIFWYIYQSSTGITATNLFFLTKDQQPEMDPDTGTITFLNGTHLVVRVVTDELVIEPQPPSADNFLIQFYKDNKFISTVGKQNDPNTAIGFSYGRSKVFDVPTGSGYIQRWKYAEFSSQSKIRHQAPDGTVDYSLDVLNEPLQVNVVTKYGVWTPLLQTKTDSPRFLFKTKHPWTGSESIGSIPWDKCAINDGRHYCFGHRYDQSVPTNWCVSDKSCDYLVYGLVLEDLKLSRKVVWYIYTNSVRKEDFYFFVTKKAPAIPPSPQDITFLDGKHLVVRVDTNDVVKGGKLGSGHFDIAFWVDNKIEGSVIERSSQDWMNFTGFLYGRAKRFRIPGSTEQRWRYFEIVTNDAITHKAADGTVDYAVDLFKESLVVNVVRFDQLSRNYVADHSVPAILFRTSDTTTTTDGSTTDESTTDGSTTDESTKDGSTKDGSTTEESTTDGSTDDGSTKPSSESTSEPTSEPTSGTGDPTEEDTEEPTNGSEGPKVTPTSKNKMYRNIKIAIIVALTIIDVLLITGLGCWTMKNKKSQ